jgi:nucleoside-diphosphate-sugar epimerase
LLQAADLPMKDVSGSQRDLGRILITGARGFIGAALVRALAQNGETVTASDLAGDATDAADFRACDITNAHEVDELFDRDRFDTIVHCGAISGPMVIADRPLDIWRINVLGTAHLLEAVRRQGIGWFVLCSSCSVYGAMSGATIDEDSPPDPASFYGASKLAAEQAMIGYVREHGIAAVALRLAWVYGPGRRTPTTLEELVRATLDGRSIEIAVSPAGMTHYVYIEDVVAGLIAPHPGQAPCRGPFTTSRPVRVSPWSSSLPPCAAWRRKPA